jgi:hypothetical protein
MVWALLLAALCAVAVALLNRLASRRRTRAWPVRAREVLTPVQQELYRRLLEAFPEHVILVQVGLPQLIELDPARPRIAVFKRFRQLVAEFVVCTKGFAAVAVVELDDPRAVAARSASAHKTDVLASAGIRLVRIAAGKLPGVRELQSMVLRSGAATSTGPIETPRQGNKRTVTGR